MRMLSVSGLHINSSVMKLFCAHTFVWTFVCSLQSWPAKQIFNLWVEKLWQWLQARPPPPPPPPPTPSCALMLTCFCVTHSQLVRNAGTHTYNPSQLRSQSFSLLEDQHGIILSCYYNQQIPWRGQNQQWVCLANKFCLCSQSWIWLHANSNRSVRYLTFCFWHAARQSSDSMIHKKCG